MKNWNHKKPTSLKKDRGEKETKFDPFSYYNIPSQKHTPSYTDRILYTPKVKLAVRGKKKNRMSPQI